MGRRQRVLTGCADCSKCTTSRVGVGVRNTGRVGAAVATAGVSEVAMAFSGTCNTCGHQMSLHDRPGSQSLAGRLIGAAVAPHDGSDGRPFPPSFYEGHQAQAAPAPTQPAPIAGSGPDAGWYSDPDGTPNLRWWNGQTWTDHRK
ncbi:DUF2510 domain-containing protein [Microbacterium sp. HSID17254]|uniref:DUF2510 domain-containing protein n=1 Tax=Microbacterium sp. HSID17254 TaxID=2419509 RepID=UPI000F89B290|nr:DUF2510 domain-containing protein [Microbacterium sp. HSID17254]RUQ07048.1 DUF2510 domain-containing protein [Microbacterium sp. HSID17254]